MPLAGASGYSIWPTAGGAALRLAIVGSRELDGYEPAYRLIQTALESCPVRVVISGGAIGVDTIAEELAVMLGISTEIYLPRARNWAAYKERNMKIAEACDKLWRVTCRETKTYGSGWTRDYATRLGKPTEETIVL